MPLVVEAPERAMDRASSMPYHEPVLVEAVVTFLAPRPGGVVVDATCGTAGHSLAFLPHLLPDGRLIAVDRDADALTIARQRLADFGAQTPSPTSVSRGSSSPAGGSMAVGCADPAASGKLVEGQVTFHHGNFRELSAILRSLDLARVDGVLLDLGMSSLQVERPERGFSFLREGPLDMRMDVRRPLTAATLVHERSEQDLAQLLWTLGEERFSRRIARRIVAERRRHPIATTTELARLVQQAVPRRAAHARLHPATRTFQALRIAVNDELGALEAALEVLPDLLVPGGRAVILSFHSLEDRRVKQAFAAGQRAGLWTILTKKPIRPDAEEIARNPRARSVKLRAVERR